MLSTEAREAHCSTELGSSKRFISNKADFIFTPIKSQPAIQCVKIAPFNSICCLFNSLLWEMTLGQVDAGPGGREVHTVPPLP